MPDEPRFVIGTDDREAAVALRRGFGDSQSLAVVDLVPDQFAAFVLLDAEWFPLTMTERWGPRLIIGRAQILETADSIGNLPAGSVPPYVIAGPALAVPLDPIAELRFIVTSTLDAVREFNLGERRKIGTIGIWYEFLRHPDGPEAAARVIREEVDRSH